MHQRAALPYRQDRLQLQLLLHVLKMLLLLLHLLADVQLRNDHAAVRAERDDEVVQQLLQVGLLRRREE